MKNDDAKIFRDSAKAPTALVSGIANNGCSADKMSAALCLKNLADCFNSAA
jgi:hypothetical protein